MRRLHDICLMGKGKACCRYLVGDAIAPSWNRYWSRRSRRG
ncbi:MAG: hypothetical protein AAAB20_23570 [Rhizobium sp.]|jgi:hypothetical protein